MTHTNTNVDANFRLTISSLCFHTGELKKENNLPDFIKLHTENSKTEEDKVLIQMRSLNLDGWTCDFMSFLARLDKVQEELLYYPGVGAGVGISKKFNVKVFLCDGQGAVRRAILSL